MYNEVVISTKPYRRRLGEINPARCATRWKIHIRSTSDTVKVPHWRGNQECYPAHVPRSARHKEDGRRTAESPSCALGTARSIKEPLEARPDDSGGADQAIEPPAPPTGQGRPLLHTLRPRTQGTWSVPLPSSSLVRLAYPSHNTNIFIEDFAFDPTSAPTREKRGTCAVQTAAAALTQTE